MHIQTGKKGAPMNEQPFSSFITLIALDQEIRTLHEAIAQLKSESETYLTQKQELTDRLTQFKQHVRDLRKKVDEQELEIKSLDEQERAKKEQMDTATSSKQLMPLKKEIDRLKQAQHQTENDLMAIWNKLEIATKELAQQEKNYDAKIEELHTLINSEQEKVVALSSQLEQKKKERPTKEAGVPEEWLEKYTHMRMRVADPVVPVMRNGCSACFYTITDQELMRLKRRAIVQCKGCFRLLYIKEIMEAQAEPLNEER